MVAHVRVCVCSYVRVYVCTCICMYVRACVCMCVIMYARMYVRMHILVRIYVHTGVNSGLPRTRNPGFVTEGQDPHRSTTKGVPIDVSRRAEFNGRVESIRPRRFFKCELLHTGDELISRCA